MNKIFILLILSAHFVFGQDGGYLGRHHNIGLQTDFHLGKILAYSDQNHSTIRYFMLKPSYEAVLAKHFSLVSTIGFLHYSEGEVEIKESNSEYNSLLFTDGPITSGTYASGDKYYVSGFEINVKPRFYPYRRKGTLAPLGSYTGLIVGFTNYRTHYYNSKVGSSRVNLGLELGRQTITFDYVTIDCGVSTAITVTPGKEGYWSSAPSDIVSVRNGWLNLYVKIGYLPW